MYKFEKSEPNAPLWWRDDVKLRLCCPYGNTYKKL